MEKRAFPLELFDWQAVGAKYVSTLLFVSDGSPSLPNGPLHNCAATIEVVLLNAQHKPT
jgi:hypothetical protein